MKKEHVNLTAADREQLEKQLQGGNLKARTYKRISGLLALDQGQTYESASAVAHLSSVSLSKLAKRYAAEGLACLIDLPRPGRPVGLSQEVRDNISVLACEEAPEGHSQWSLRLLADKVVELGYCDTISHTQVGKILQKKD